MGRVSHARVVPSSTIGGASSASSSADARPRMTACPRSRNDSTVASSTGWWSPRSITDRTVTSAAVLPPGTSRHPWNDAFTFTLPDVEPTTITREQRAAFDRDGYLALPGLLDRDTVDGLVEDLDRLEAEGDQVLA